MGKLTTTWSRAFSTERAAQKGVDLLPTLPNKISFDPGRTSDGIEQLFGKKVSNKSKVVMELQDFKPIRKKDKILAKKQSEFTSEELRDIAVNYDFHHLCSDSWFEMRQTGYWLNSEFHRQHTHVAFKRRVIFTKLIKKFLD